MPALDPDAALTAVFKNFAVLNPNRTAAEGRAIFEDMEIVEIRSPGSRNTVVVQPATAVCDWQIDPLTGGQIQRTYAERFRHQYQQFKQSATQTKVGTPLTHVPFLTEARRAELRALNVYTVEQLASVDGQELKNLGVGGRDLKNQALEFIEQSKQAAPNAMLQAELEALRARNAILEEDAEAMARAVPSDEFDAMTLEALRDYVTAQSGHTPQGSLNRKALTKLAIACRPKEKVE